MKRIIILSISLLLFNAVILLAQARADMKFKDEPATKVESFIIKKGQVIVKDFYDIGELKNYQNKAVFNALIVYESSQEANKVKGLRVEISENVSGIERNNISILDKEEVESLITSIDYFIEIAKKWKDQPRDAYTEVIYSSKDNFEIGFYQNNNEQKLFISSGYISKTTIVLKIEDLIKIKNMAERCLKIFSLVK